MLNQGIFVVWWAFYKIHDIELLSPRLKKGIVWHCWNHAIGILIFHGKKRYIIGILYISFKHGLLWFPFGFRFLKVIFKLVYHHPRFLFYVQIPAFKACIWCVNLVLISWETFSYKYLIYWFNYNWLTFLYCAFIPCYE